MTLRQVCTALSLLALPYVNTATADDSSENWRGFRGTRRTGKSPDTGLLRSWPSGGPKLLWQQNAIGEGFSSVAVVDGLVYITGGKDGQLVLSAFDLGGNLKWERVHGEAWTRNYPGGRATPTISRGLLYLLSGPGKIACYDAATGQPVWSREMSEFGGHPGGWGYAESGLSAGNMIIFTPCGSKAGVVALDKKTGKTIWTSEGNGGGAHYGSCILAVHEKIPMIIGSTGNGLFAVHPRGGKVLWTNSFSSGNTANCPTPAYSDGRVFWANGYGKGGVCIELEAIDGEIRADEAWRTQDMVCHHGGYVIHEGFIYGNNGGGWACLELASGKTMWKAKGVGKGSVCFADGLLFLFSERAGKVGLAEASTQGLQLTGEFSVDGDGPSWAHPVVIGGRLYLRYANNLYCFDVRK